MLNLLIVINILCTNCIPISVSWTATVRTAHLHSCFIHPLFFFLVKNYMLFTKHQLQDYCFWKRYHRLLLRLNILSSPELRDTINLLWKWVNIKVNSMDECILWSKTCISETKYLSSYKIKIKSKQVTRMSINIINADEDVVKGIIIKCILQSKKIITEPKYNSLSTLT